MPLLKYFTFFLALVTVNAAKLLARAPGDVCVLGSVAYADRIDCGTASTTEADCLADGCCWERLDGPITGPICYVPPDEIPTPSPQCPVVPLPYSDRADCGTAETTEAECVADGCCWERLDGPITGPICYVPPDEIPTPSPQCPVVPLPYSDREDCGTAETTEVECVAGGCCWERLDGPITGPICYVPPETVDPPIEPTPSNQPATCPLRGTVPKYWRVDCNATSADECNSKGCCWDTSPALMGFEDLVEPFGSWCYVVPPVLPTETRCPPAGTFPIDERDTAPDGGGPEGCNIGWEYGCLNSPAGCCWDPINAGMTSPCFKKPSVEEWMPYAPEDMDCERLVNAIVLEEDIADYLIDIDPGCKLDLPLRTAAEFGLLATVQLLLADDRVDPAAIESHAFRLASWNNQLDVVRELIEDGRSDVNAINGEAYRNACRWGRYELVELLIAQPGILYSIQRERYYGMRWAVKAGYVRIVRLLLDDGRQDLSAEEYWNFFWPPLLYLNPGSVYRQAYIEADYKLVLRVLFTEGAEYIPDWDAAVERATNELINGTEADLTEFEEMLALLTPGVGGPRLSDDLIPEPPQPEKTPITLKLYLVSKYRDEFLAYTTLPQGEADITSAKLNSLIASLE